MSAKQALSSVCSAILLLAVTGSPAAANMVRLGSVYLDPAEGRPVQFNQFGGGIERLGFRASQSALTCDSIRARYSDGKTYIVFQGYLTAGQETDVELPSGGARIQDLDIQCRGNGLPAAAIDVLVDPGTHGNEWRANPRWNTDWWYRFDSGLDKSAATGRS